MCSTQYSGVEFFTGGREPAIAQYHSIEITVKMVSKCGRGTFGTTRFVMRHFGLISVCRGVDQL